MNVFSSRPNSFPDFSPSTRRQINESLVLLRLRVLSSHGQFSTTFMSLRFALFPRYKLLKKALLANWLTSFDDASLRRTASFKILFSLSLSNFRPTPPSFSSCLSVSPFLYQKHRITNSELFSLSAACHQPRYCGINFRRQFQLLGFLHPIASVKLNTTIAAPKIESIVYQNGRNLSSFQFFYCKYLWNSRLEFNLMKFVLFNFLFNFIFVCFWRDLVWTIGTVNLKIHQIFIIIYKIPWK